MTGKRRQPSPMMSSVSELVEALPDTFLTAGSGFAHTIELEVDRIGPSPEQAREVFARAEIEGLARTMATQGQLQPIRVRRHPEVRGAWLLVAGERRLRAAKLLRWRKILAIEHEGDPEIAALLENLQRVDLNVVEEARGLRRLLEARGWTQAEAADALGKRLSDLNGALGVLALPAGFLDRFLKSEIPVSRNALIELARVGEGPGRERLMTLALAGQLTVAAVRTARETVRPRRGRAGPGPTGEKAGLPLAVVGRLRASIRSLRRAAHPLSEPEREELAALAGDIRAWLGPGTAPRGRKAAGRPNR